MQRLVDNLLAVTKESVKTFTYESLNNIVRLINGISALLLAFLPGKASILEGIHGWELKPTFRAPKLPRWMENGVSSFNQFIHEFSVDSDTSCSTDYSSEEDSDENIPGSPLSHSSRASRANRSKNNWYWINCLRWILSWFFIPLKILLGLPLFLHSYRRPTIASSTPESLGPSLLGSPRRLQTIKDNFIQHATDRRRGIVEDLHLGVEIFIEAIFDIVHKATRRLLAPLDTLRAVFRWSISPGNGSGSYPADSPVVSVTTSTLSESDPAVTEKKIIVRNSLNTDARTCQDVITELGYPYEAITVVTADGYVLLLERIPRRESRKVVYLQHGVLDSSMGWVANGVVGSPAFAAYDQGYDVFLGNFRGLISREHANKNISSREYWRYSINEHGTQDIPAMVEKIHEIKVSELETCNMPDQVGDVDSPPYKLCAICHSLGGASILMYLITRQIDQKPHRLSRLILLSPAGFHDDSTFVFTLIEHVFLMVAPLLELLVPAFYVPTRFFRMLLNKLARDFHKLPAVGGLVQTLMSYVVGGDSSNWVGVLGLPHYNMNDMPGVSFRVALHLAQMKRAKKFMMFDYGSPAANMDVYGTPEPVDLGEHYDLIDIPVDLVGGRKDRVIRPSMIRKHYKLMKNAGVDVSYNESEYAHLDFTFSHNEELLSYVMSRLFLVGPPSRRTQKPLKLKKKEGTGEASSLS